MNVLFVGAHPDDIEAYAGGTAARYRAAGHKVFFCICTNGNVGSSTLPPAEIAAVRRAEAEAAAAVIGAHPIFLDFDDEFLLDTRETRLAVINAIRIAAPEVVVCHWRNDYNPDHSISGFLVDECVSMASIPNIKTATSPIGHIPHVYYMDTPAGVNFVPELYVDITDVFDTKVAMLSKHESQDSWMTDLFGYDMKTFLEIPGRYRGLQAGVPLAEAFAPSQRWGRTFTQHLLPDCLSVATGKS